MKLSHASQLHNIEYVMHHNKLGYFTKIKTILIGLT